MSDTAPPPNDRTNDSMQRPVSGSAATPGPDGGSSKSPPFRRAMQTAWPIAVVGCAILVAWYVLAIRGNWPQAQQGMAPHATFWQTVQASMSLDNPWVPPPHQVVQDLWYGLVESASGPHVTWVHVGTTAEEAGLGLLAGTLLGILIATLFVHAPLAEISFMPYVVASQTVPILALAPILINLVGINLKAKVIVTTYLVFFAVAVSAVKGLKSASPLAHELMRSYAANTWQVYWKLRFPAALPYIFTGLKISSTAALVGAMVAELIGSEYGLGALLVAGNTFGRDLLLWSTMLAGSILGLGSYLLLTLVERAVVRARPRLA
ncbi:MAG: transporter permease [Chloroflexi bacterium]|nr:transporter permease [Chloroflexota bacterium]